MWRAFQDTLLCLPPTPDLHGLSLSLLSFFSTTEPLVVKARLPLATGQSALLFPFHDATSHLGPLVRSWASLSAVCRLELEPKWLRNPQSFGIPRKNIIRKCHPWQFFFWVIWNRRKLISRLFRIIRGSFQLNPVNWTSPICHGMQKVVLLQRTLFIYTYVRKSIHTAYFLRLHNTMHIATLRSTDMRRMPPVR